MDIQRVLERWKPAAGKSVLLGTAGTLWALAGVMLGVRGYMLFGEARRNSWAFGVIGIIAGVAFFVILFRKIADRYIARIVLLPSDRPCFFSFLSVRGYLTMGVMIGLGLILRSIQEIPRDDLGAVYFAVAVPLVLSSFRFIRRSFVPVLPAGAPIPDNPGK